VTEKKDSEKFEARVLNDEELSQVIGGDDCPTETGSTMSVCHIDGVNDGD
jgi:bacteriocin-like protein